jgi:hypothetical protein
MFNTHSKILTEYTIIKQSDMWQYLFKIKATPATIKMKIKDIKDKGVHQQHYLYGFVATSTLCN